MQNYPQSHLLLKIITVICLPSSRNTMNAALLSNIINHHLEIISNNFILPHFFSKDLTISLKMCTLYQQPLDLGQQVKSKLISQHMLEIVQNIQQAQIIFNKHKYNVHSKL